MDVHAPVDSGARGRTDVLLRSDVWSPTMDVDLDRHGLELLTRVECLGLLASRGLGRVSVSMGALPVILPVAYRVAGEAVIIRTTPGTRLDAALANQVVAFE